MNGLQAAGVILALGGLVLIAPAAPASAAGKYDGSKPMLCAVTAVSECTKDGNCERSAPQEGNNLPGFVRIDVKGKLLSGTKVGASVTPACLQIPTASMKSARVCPLRSFRSTSSLTDSTALVIMRQPVSRNRRSMAA